MKKWKGREVITTDGNSLLGADDKSGITEIMETIVYLIDNPDLKHGDIYIGFTPDEEIGRGTDNFELDKFKCDYAYTIDGGLEGEINYENFNAASANVTFLGQNIHPGTAKDKMVNSMKIAMEFDSHLNQNMVPEKTDKYQGFNHLTDIKGDVTNTHLHYIIRNHDMDLFKKQKNDFLEIEKLINKKYGANRCKVDIKDSYFNMHEYLKDNMFIVEKIINATKSAGVDTIVKPIRGGTDGALLTYKGLMTPNVGTGGANFHGNLECISIEGMMLVKSILINLLTTK